MGTRSLTIVQDNGKENLVMYRQFDGYPDGHGLELFNKFGDYKICNGIPLGRDMSSYANGMGCLAAQVVAYFKKEVGGFYLYPSGTRNTGEEYIYFLYQGESGNLCLKLIEPAWEHYPEKVRFDGHISQYGDWLKTIQEQEPED